MHLAGIDFPDLETQMLGRSGSVRGGEQHS